MNDVLLDYHGLACACHQFTKLLAALSPAYFGSSGQPTLGSTAIAAACPTSSIAKIHRCFPSVICSESWQVAARRESTLAATIAGLCSGHVAMPTSSTAFLLVSPVSTLSKFCFSCYLASDCRCGFPCTRPQSLFYQI